MTCTSNQDMVAGTVAPLASSGSDGHHVWPLALPASASERIGVVGVEGGHRALINRSPDTDIEAEFRLPDYLAVETATVEELNGPGWDATNSFEHPERVVVAHGVIEKFTTGVRHVLPAHSMTVITLPYR